MPINIKSIEIQNFKSFGDYLTKIDLDNLGPVLIIGECESTNQTKNIKSNGAGKSSLINAITWAIWGRTADKAKPGDSVINWAIGKNCYVKLETTDGYTIIRTRRFKNKDELIFMKDGKDYTLSTNTLAQNNINKVFGLDYNIFMSSVFFEQRAKPILELPPQQRRTVIEKMLQLHKFHYRADIAKELMNAEETLQKAMSIELDMYKREKIRIDQEVIGYQKMQIEFEAQRKLNISNIDNKLLNLTNTYDAITIPNIDDLRSKWDNFYKLEDKLILYTKQKNEIDLEISKLDNLINLTRDNINESISQSRDQQEIDLDNITNLWNVYNNTTKQYEHSKETHNAQQNEIKNIEFQIKEKSRIMNNWQRQAGTTCPTCSQNVSSDHAGHMAKPYIDELSELINKKRELEAKLTLSESTLKSFAVKVLEKPYITIEMAKSVYNSKIQMQNTLNAANTKIKEHSEMKFAKIKDAQQVSTIINKIKDALQNKPDMTISDANNIISRKNDIKGQLDSLYKARCEVKETENPYSKLVERLTDSGNINTDKINDLTTEIQKKNIAIIHYNYIKKAYADKTKIKSFVLNGMIPILNNRLKYYLDQFGFEMADIEFNVLLDLESSKWDYSTYSGGERQCIDLALMFALYDLNAMHFGRQSNLMILDEVDTRLDSNYVEKLASVIVDDLGSHGTTKPNTILVVSHKNDMLDAFPTKIFVTKEKEFSHVRIEK